MNNFMNLRTSLLSDDAALMAQSFKDIREGLKNAHLKSIRDDILLNSYNCIWDFEQTTFDIKDKHSVYTVQENALGGFIVKGMANEFMYTINWNVNKSHIISYLDTKINLLNNLYFNDNGKTISNDEVIFALECLKKYNQDKRIVEYGSLPIFITPYTHKDVNAFYSNATESIIMFNSVSDSSLVEILLHEIGHHKMNVNKTYDLSKIQSFTRLFEYVCCNDKSVVKKEDWAEIYSDWYALALLYDTQYEIQNEICLDSERYKAIHKYFTEIVA